MKLKPIRHNRFLIDDVLGLRVYIRRIRTKDRLLKKTIKAADEVREERDLLIKNIEEIRELFLMKGKKNERTSRTTKEDKRSLDGIRGKDPDSGL